MDTDALLRECETLLDILYANPEHLKLSELVADIEDLRDRLKTSELHDAHETQDP
jgi:hypothetical protein